MLLSLSRLKVEVVYNEIAAVDAVNDFKGS